MNLLLLSLLTAHAASVRASSQHVDADGSNTAAMAFDGRFDTGWAEDAVGTAKGQWIELDLGRSTTIHNVTIWPGNLKKGARSFREYGRPRTMIVQVDGKPQGKPIIIEDKAQRVNVPVTATGRPQNER